MLDVTPWPGWPLTLIGDDPLADGQTNTRSGKLIAAVETQEDLKDFSLEANSIVRYVSGTCSWRHLSVVDAGDFSATRVESRKKHERSPPRVLVAGTFRV